MQKLIFIIIIAISVLNTTVYSQPFGEAVPEYVIIELLYENSSGEKGITYFRYDYQYKLIKAKWSLDNKKRYSNNYYEYDSNGNLVSTFRDFSDGIISYECFNYDTTGNKISEYFYRSDGITGSAVYTYNSNQLIAAEFINHKGWLNGRLEIQYDRNNQKNKGVLLKDNNIIGEISYDYDTTGNLIREFWDFNGKWSQTYNYIYTKKNKTMRFYSSPYLSTESNYRVCREYYTYNNEIGGTSFYYYNKHGLLEEKIYIRNDNFITNTFFNYDTEGRLISSKRIYSDSSVDIFTFTYNKENKLINRSLYKSDTLYGFEAYLYNSDGELIKAYLRNFDGWLSGTINFQSNESGKIANADFTGENGVNASIIFSYNQENLISEIKWKFTSGKFQQYNFKYEHINSP
jgi:hypothetical protein